MWKGVLLVGVCATAVAATSQQRPPVNEDEAKVPPYTLPDPLRLENGERVTTARAWRVRRRPELLRLFKTEVYGRSAPAPTSMRFVSRGVDHDALGGTAVRKQVSILFTGADSGPSMELLIYVPKTAQASRLGTVPGLRQPPPYRPSPIENGPRL